MSQIYALLSVKFSGVKMCWCKKGDKYEVCSNVLKSQSEYKKFFSSGFEDDDDLAGMILSRAITLDGSERPRKVIYGPDIRHDQIF